jgi:hypothetical protein
MKLQRNITMKSGIFCATIMALGVVVGGCKTGKGTGALVGGGLGAAIGAAAGEGEGALIGAAIGTGVGYIIGDQVDEKKAREMSAKGDTHNEVGSLGGTRWRVISLNSDKPVPPYASKVVEFRPDGRVITTTTKPDGDIETADESYRVVGSTLIVNKPGYLVNARFKLDGKRLIIDDPGFSAVLERLPA